MKSIQTISVHAIGHNIQLGKSCVHDKPMDFSLCISYSTQLVGADGQSRGLLEVPSNWGVFPGHCHFMHALPDAYGCDLALCKYKLID